MNESISFVNALPPNDRRTDQNYLASLDLCIQKSCDLGFKYTLITIGDKRFDPWILAQYGLSKNINFKPLIAVNPIHQHPVALTKRLLSLHQIFKSNIALNLVSGSFISELKSINNNLNFEQRSERLIEFLEVCYGLSSKNSTYSFKGQYYQIENVDLYPEALPDFKSQFFISGYFESKFSQSMTDQIYFVKNYRPLDQLPKSTSPNSGLNVGLCVRKTQEEALLAVEQLYPTDRQGELLSSLALNNNETPWNIWIKDFLKTNRDDDPFFYLKPFKAYKSSAPFIVGSYEKVAEQLIKCSQRGYNFFVLDFHQNDYEHIEALMKIIKSN